MGYVSKQYLSLSYPFGNDLCSSKQREYVLGEGTPLRIFFFYREGPMIKELTCAACGCEDVKLIPRTVSMHPRIQFFNIVCLIISVVPLAVGIVSLALAFNTYLSSSDLSPESSDYIVTMSFIGGIAIAVGTVLFFTTFLIYFYNAYDAKTELIAVCPRCGKSRLLTIKKDGRLQFAKTAADLPHTDRSPENGSDALPREQDRRDPQ